VTEICHGKQGIFRFFYYTMKSLNIEVVTKFGPITGCSFLLRCHENKGILDLIRKLTEVSMCKWHSVEQHAEVS